MLENFSAVIISYLVEKALLGLKPWFLRLLNVFEAFYGKWISLSKYTGQSSFMATKGTIDKL